jgi:hypothetical protein
MFITKAGPIYIVPMIDKISEGPIKQQGSRAVDWQTNFGSLSHGADDVDEYILVAVYRGELSSGGAYGVLRIQPANDAQITLGDIWAKTRIGPIAVEAEGVYLTGHMFNFVSGSTAPRLDAHQWAFAMETAVPMKAITPGFDIGAASGDSSGPNAGHLDNFVFDRDYHIANLLFRYVTPNGAPHAVTNAVYLKPKVKWETSDSFSAEAALIYAQALSAIPTQYDSGTYGTELDVGASWKLYDGFEAGLRYSALLPGSALKSSAPGATGKLDPVIHGLEGRFLVRF